MDSGNDKPLSPNPTVDYFDDLDYFKDLENEFPAIVYNDGLTSKLDLGIKPLINSKCIVELNLINETSLSEYDEEIIWHHYQLLIRGTHGLDISLRSILRRLGVDLALKLRIIFPVMRTAGICESYLEAVVLDLGAFSSRVYSGEEDDLEAVYLGIGVTHGAGDAESSFLEPTGLVVKDNPGEGQAPEKVTGVDLFYLRIMNRGTANVPQLLAQYLFRHAEGRKSGARLSGGHFMCVLAMHFVAGL
ncbi:hypothetical protein Tco_0716440 [Tanacetum coccineum]